VSASQAGTNHYPPPHTNTRAQAAAPSVPEQHPSSAPTAAWQVLYTPEGRPYYFNPSTNVTQWEPPPGM